MAHREGIREFLKDVQVHGLVIDWGCGTKPIKNYLKENDARFIGIDKLDHVDADIVTDIEDEYGTFIEEVNENDGADFAFCLEVIEHCWNAKNVLFNIYNNLMYGGVLYLSQPFMYEVHKEDDRIRYTYYGLEQLLEEVGFKNVEVHSTGNNLDNAWGYVVKAVK